MVLEEVDLNSVNVMFIPSADRLCSTFDEQDYTDFVVALLLLFLSSRIKGCINMKMFTVMFHDIKS